MSAGEGRLRSLSMHRFLRAGSSCGGPGRSEAGAGRLTGPAFTG